jgi:hypothetical protein
VWVGALGSRGRGTLPSARARRAAAAAAAARSARCLGRKRHTSAAMGAACSDCVPKKRREDDIFESIAAVDSKAVEATASKESIETVASSQPSKTSRQKVGWDDHSVADSKAVEATASKEAIETVASSQQSKTSRQKVGSDDHSAALRDALGRLGRMHNDLLAMAQQMRAVFPPDTIHHHLVERAAELGAPICWERDDLVAYFMESSPETLLPARLHMQRPPPAVLAALPALLLGGRAAFETRDGQLRLAIPSSMGAGKEETYALSRSTGDQTDDAPTAWLSELSECADPRCGCFRPKHPRVRSRFREALLAMLARAPPRRRLRYVSVGAGGLLYDLELLVALDGSAVLRLASLLPGAQVHAFDHVDSYREQAATYPDTFANGDIYVQCDCDDVDDEQAREVAADALAPGGVALLMRGDGSVVHLDDDGQWRPCAGSARDSAETQGRQGAATRTCGGEDVCSASHVARR